MELEMSLIRQALDGYPGVLLKGLGLKVPHGASIMATRSKQKPAWINISK